MSLTLKNNADANVTYNLRRDASSAGQLVRSYYGPLSTDTQKDDLVIKSTDPKRVGDSYGVRRTSIAYYKNFTIAGPSTLASSKDMKVELSISIPIGWNTSVVSAAEFHEACARIQAFLSSEAYMAAVAFTGVSPD